MVFYASRAELGPNGCHGGAEALPRTTPADNGIVCNSDSYRAEGMDIPLPSSAPDFE